MPEVFFTEELMNTQYYRQVVIISCTPEEQVRLEEASCRFCGEYSCRFRLRVILKAEYKRTKQTCEEKLFYFFCSKQCTELWLLRECG